jgi:hypothetical protein
MQHQGKQELFQFTVLYSQAPHMYSSAIVHSPFYSSVAHAGDNCSFTLLLSNNTLSSPTHSPTSPNNPPSLLQAGCTKVFITSRKASACDSAVAALNSLPNKPPHATAISIPADSSKLSEITRLVSEVSKHTDHVDILFANAGATWGSTFDEVDEKNGWDKVMDLNVKGVFFTIQKYVFPLHKLIKSRNGLKI